MAEESEEVESWWEGEGGGWSLSEENEMKCIIKVIRYVLGGRNNKLRRFIGRMVVPSWDIMRNVRDDFNTKWKVDSG